MKKRTNAINMVWTVVLSIAAVLYMYPIIMILFNSLKKETAITTAGAFELPTTESFARLENILFLLRNC